MASTVAAVVRSATGVFQGSASRLKARRSAALCGAAAASRRVAKPKAARSIARLIADQAGVQD